MNELIKAELIWDGGETVNLPSSFEKPTPEQMIGTAHERLGEVSMRICYDDQTELLTRDRGWILFNDLNGDCNSEVMTLNPVSLEAEWQNPSEVIRDHFEGDLIAYDSREASLWVTPNHRHWVRLQGTNNFQFIEAQFLMDKKAYALLCAKDWRGFTPDQVVVPDFEYEVMSRHKTKLCLKKSVLGKTFIGNQIQSFAEFITYFVTEGFNTPEKGFVTITGHHVDEVTRLLQDLKYPYHIYVDPRNDCPFVRVTDKSLCDYIETYCGRYAKNKRMPRWVMDLPRTNLQAIHKVFVLTDCMKGNGISYEPILSSSSNQLANDFQEILFKIGYGSFLRWRDDYLCESLDDSRVIKSRMRRYIVSGKKRQTCLIGGKKKLRREPYSGDVFCVKTENGIIVTRRKGKVVISGNCYESMGIDPVTKKPRGRSSEKAHKHILEVHNESVYEHCVSTLRLDCSTSDVSPETLACVFMNRPGCWLELNRSGVEITLNHRSILEWDRWKTSFSNRYDFTNRNVGTEIRNIARKLAPQLYPDNPKFMSRMGFKLKDPKDFTEHQAWVSLYLSGSRGLSHEQVRHGNETAISQRSTRFVDEDGSPYVTHPTTTYYLNTVDPSESIIVQDLIDKAVAAGRLAYHHLADGLQKFLKARGVEGTNARKQARGAARGYLGNALFTEMIFSASVAQWRWMLNQRGSIFADAEIRELYAPGVLRELQKSQYSRFFEDLELQDSPDEIGQIVVKKE